MAIANGDVASHMADKEILTNAAARAAVDEVWNSDMYEYPVAADPATLKYEFFSQKIRLDGSFWIHTKSTRDLQCAGKKPKNDHRNCIYCKSRWKWENECTSCG